jgi:hypothetical protein
MWLYRLLKQLHHGAVGLVVAVLGKSGLVDDNAMIATPATGNCVFQGPEVQATSGLHPHDGARLRTRVQEGT